MKGALPNLYVSPVNGMGAESPDPKCMLNFASELLGDAMQSSASTPASTGASAAGSEPPTKRVKTGGRKASAAPPAEQKAHQLEINRASAKRRRTKTKELLASIGALKLSLQAAEKALQDGASAWAKEKTKLVEERDAACEEAAMLKKDSNIIVLSL